MKYVCVVLVIQVRGVKNQIPTLLKNLKNSKNLYLDGGSLQRFQESKKLTRCVGASISGKGAVFRQIHGKRTFHGSVKQVQGGREVCLLLLKEVQEDAGRGVGRVADVW